MDRRGFLLACAWPSIAQAANYRLGSLAMSNPWALPKATLSESRMFVLLANHGKEEDALLGGRSAVCADLQLRRNDHYEDPPLKSFTLPAGATLQMAPRSNHLRLMGLRRRLEPQMRFPLILDFLNSGEIEIEVEVALREPS